MAVTLSQEPSNIINAAYSDIVYTLQGGATTQFYHKYVLKVFVGNSTGTNLVATLKASANESGKGIFNIANILQDFCTTDKEGFVDVSGQVTATFNGVAASSVRHSIHQTDAFSANTDNVKQFYVRFTEEYATTADGIVTEQAISTPTTKKLVFNAAHEHANGLDTFNGFDFCLSSTNSKLLTGFDSSINRKIRRGDFHTLAFLAGTFGSVAAQQSYPTHFELQLYTYNGAALGAAIDIDVSLNNNAFPVSLFNWSAGFSGTEGALWHFGCGVANLVNNGLTIPDPNTVSYTLQAFNQSTPISEIYTFDIIDDDCKGFETIRLAYLNRLGTYDYYNFTKKSTRTTAVQKNTFKSSYGTWQGNNYTYGTWEGGTNNYGVTANETIEANSDFITEAEAAALEELFTSPSVFMQNNTTSYYAYEPVVITESSYVKQTTANDKVIQYVIGLHKSHNKRIQRL